MSTYRAAVTTVCPPPAGGGCAAATSGSGSCTYRSSTNQVIEDAWIQYTADLPATAELVTMQFGADVPHQDASVLFDKVELQYRDVAPGCMDVLADNHDPVDATGSVPGCGSLNLRGQFVAKYGAALIDITIKPHVLSVEADGWSCPASVKPFEPKKLRSDSAHCFAQQARKAAWAKAKAVPKRRAAAKMAPRGRAGAAPARVPSG